MDESVSYNWLFILYYDLIAVKYRKQNHIFEENAKHGSCKDILTKIQKSVIVAVRLDCNCCSLFHKDGSLEFVDANKS